LEKLQPLQTALSETDFTMHAFRRREAKAQVGQRTRIRMPNTVYKGFQDTAVFHFLKRKAIEPVESRPSFFRYLSIGV
jgi:hypothetical protein